MIPNFGIFGDKGGAAQIPVADTTCRVALCMCACPFIKKSFKTTYWGSKCTGVRVSVCVATDLEGVKSHSGASVPCWAQGRMEIGPSQ